MAKVHEDEINAAAGEETTHDLSSLLSGKERDFLVRNNGDQVKISELQGKVVGLYFSASWCGPCRRFTPQLVDIYNELCQKGSNFEIVFVSADTNEDEFVGYFSKMPWLAIPFSDAHLREKLDEVFEVNGIPHLVFLDANGKVITSDGVEVAKQFGSEAYPFTAKRIKEMKEEEEARKLNQTLQSILVSPSRDFVISKEGNKVSIGELEGKIVGIYFSISKFSSCHEFTQILAGMYSKLKENGQSFEVVLVSLDDDEASFSDSIKDMPWLAIPFKDKICEKLVRYFDLETIPTLVVIGSNGKTLNTNAAEIVEEHGIDAYPFTPEKLEELAEKEKSKLESQTLESLLVSGELDYVIGKGDIKVPVSDLVGKTILLYFSAEWCPPCRMFLPKLVEAYHKIKEKENALEVIFISSDEDQSSFDDFFSEMPWLAIPYGDPRKKSLSRTFKVQGIPMLVAIDLNGKTITTEARDLVADHGAAAYPFTEERIQEIERQFEETANAWPEKLKHKLHQEHELIKSRRSEYICDECNEHGTGWSFCCSECDFDLHPACALAEDKDVNDDEEGEELENEEGKEGYICNGEVCRKV